MPAKSKKTKRTTSSKKNLSFRATHPNKFWLWFCITLLVIIGAFSLVKISSGLLYSPTSINRIIELDPTTTKSQRELQAVQAVNKAADKAEKTKNTEAKEKATAELLVAGSAYQQIRKDDNFGKNKDDDYKEYETAAKKDLVKNDLITNDLQLTDKGREMSGVNTSATNTLPKTSLSPSNTTSGRGFCATNGNPVLEGTWAATGNYDDPKNLTAETALCRRCGADGSFSGETKTCYSVIGTNPVVLPSHYESFKKADGSNVVFKKCFAQVGNAYVQVAPGDKVEGDGSDMYCNPATGRLVSSQTDALKSLCSIKGQEESNGKCVNPSPIAQAPSETNTSNLKLCGSDNDSDTNDLWCVTPNPPPESLSTLDRAKHLFTNNKCQDDQYTIKSDQTERCLPVQGTGKYAIVPANFTGSIGVTQKASIHSASDGRKFLVYTYGSSFSSTTNNSNNNQHDPTLVTFENGKVGSYAKDPSECKYAFGAVKPEGSTSYICPNEGGLSIPALNLQINDIKSNAVATQKSVGEECGDPFDNKDGCRACPNNGEYIRVQVGMEFHNICGTEAQKPANGTITSTSDKKYTLELGDVCDNSLFSSNKCNKCPGETFSSVRVGERVIKVCGSETIKDKIDIVSAQEAIRVSDGNNIRNTLVTAVAAGGAAAVPCALTGATIGALFPPLAAGGALAAGTVCFIGGAVTGAIAGNIAGPNNVPINVTP